MQEALDSI